MEESFEKLKKLLEEGKITEEQFELLKENLPKNSPPQPEFSSHFSEESHLNLGDRISREIQKLPNNPWQIWACSLFLFLVSVVHLLLGFYKPVLFLAGIIEIVLGIGLLKRWKWTYFVGIVFGFAAVASGNNISAFLINGLFLGILASAWKAFFPEKPNTKSSVIF